MKRPVEIKFVDYLIVAGRGGYVGVVVREGFVVSSYREGVLGFLALACLAGAGVCGQTDE